MAGGGGHAGMTPPEPEGMALFTNPQGVWNAYSGTLDVPPGRTRNGKFWSESARGEKKRSKAGRK
ncbi:hypothetical protein PF004_g10340 [Phytophthora fragariae]|uniref:Uncharacterized protein n=1 Tax=Phytophthora fragariae TaxID=53985 RepID=A0A6G0P162_9STRA|nr:hypothetical protein PF004_g10340 [Phytophthora fragariae]